MKNNPSFDGAWLCFYNFEGIEAEHEEFENLFIDQNLSPYPNFSALEFITSTEIMDKKGEAIKSFIQVTQDMTIYCKRNIEEAKEIYYTYSKEEKNELMDKIIEDTIPRLKSEIAPNKEKWLELSKIFRRT